MARAKERLRIYSAADDADLQLLIDAAVIAVEKATGLIIRQSTWDLIGDWLPAEIKHRPVRSITGIYYNDENEAEQTVLASDYYLVDDCYGNKEIVYVNDFINPSSWSVRRNRTRVRFTAGYDDGSLTGADPNLEMPPQVELLVLGLVGVWYDNREPVGVEEKFKIPKTFDFLLAQLKVYN